MPLIGRTCVKVDQLRVSIAQLERDAAEDRRVALKSRQLAAQRDDVVDELAAQEASGALSREAIDKRLEALERETNGHLANAEARERSADKRGRDIPALEAEIARLLIADEVVELQKALDERGARDREFAKRVDLLLAEAMKLRRAQDREAKAWAALDGTETDFDVTRYDAPDWAGDVDDLVKLLKAGPHQPVAKAAAEKRRVDKAREQRETSNREGAVAVANARETRDDARVAQLVSEYSGQGFGEAELRAKLSAYVVRERAVAAILEADAAAERMFSGSSRSGASSRA